MFYNFINFLTFQMGWWLFALKFNPGEMLLPFAFTSLLLLIHFLLVAHEDEWLLVGLVAGIGYVADSTFALAGGFKFKEYHYDFFAPLWLLGMWVFFSFFFNNSLKWVFNGMIRAGFLGFIFGPLAYWMMSAQLRKFELAEPLEYWLTIYGVMWAGLMLIFIGLQRKLMS